ncbi:MAG: hypothetical protein P8Y39_09170 [Nitrospirota bacterium]|jgi:hypothetical protein
MRKIPPSEKIREELRALLSSGVENRSLLDGVLQRGMGLILQEMLEAEATEYLGRGHYERNGSIFCFQDTVVRFMWNYSIIRDFTYEQTFPAGGRVVYYSSKRPSYFANSCISFLSILALNSLK